METKYTEHNRYSRSDVMSWLKIKYNSVYPYPLSPHLSISFTELHNFICKNDLILALIIYIFNCYNYDIKPCKNEAQTALFKDQVRTAL